MWRIVDSGRAPGSIHMETDRAALANSPSPTLRLFQWDKPSVSYGYLLNERDVRDWARKLVMSNEKLDFVRRPTGGGAVRHDTTDLSFSLLWPRGENIFSENPRACYAEIHAICVKGLHSVIASPASISLYNLSWTKQSPSSKARDCFVANDAPRNDKLQRFSACFEKPVCNDVMMGPKKILGGALRITRQAVLYQGTIQLGSNINIEMLKNQVSAALLSAFPQTSLV